MIREDMIRWRIFVAMTLVWAGALQPSAAADGRNLYAQSSSQRVALVIGNDSYRSVKPLDNARADARALAQALKDVGFAVTLKLDADQKAMEKAMRAFKAQVGGGDEAVFYFSGHGVQLGGENYLLPVDIEGQNPDQIRDDAVALQRVLDDLHEQKARFALAIIDACRDNPFRARGRAIGGRGLAPTTAATGQMVIYAAGTGQQALDRLDERDKDPNGVFTRVFVKQMKKPGVPAPLPPLDDYPPGKVFRDCADCPEMVVIPAGEFTMGSPEDELGRSKAEGPQHKVTIRRPTAVGRYEVTFEEWDACVAAGGCKHKPEDRGWGRGRPPVIDVSWDDAQQYVAWLSKKTGKGYRLLTEAEWEYAARAGSTTPYPWGNEPGANNPNFFVVGSSTWTDKKPSPVGSFHPNPFGVYDVIGNVFEWVQDCFHDSYVGAPVDGSAWENDGCGERVLRSSSWGNPADGARSSFRHGGVPSLRNPMYGIRVARALP